jgi:hypothetical protein
MHVCDSWNIINKVVLLFHIYMLSPSLINTHACFRGIRVYIYFLSLNCFCIEIQIVDHADRSCSRYNWCLWTTQSLQLFELNPEPNNPLKLVGGAVMIMSLSRGSRNLAERSIPW